MTGIYHRAKSRLRAEPGYFGMLDDLFFLIGAGYLIVEKYDLAEELLRDASNLDAPSGERAAAFNALGYVLVRTKKPGYHHEAQAAYMKAIESIPTWSVPYANLGVLYDSLGRHAEAREAHEFAFDRGMTTAESLIDSVWQLWARGDHDKAVERVGMAEEKTKGREQVSPLVWHGRLLEWAGRYEEALEYFEQAYKLDATSADPYIGAAAVHMDRGQFPEAIETAQGALNLDIRNADAWRVIGEAYECLDNCQMAIVAYQKAIDINPNSTLVHLRLASCLRLTEPQADQTEHMEKARVLIRLDGEYQYNTAALAALDGREEDALKLLQIVLERKQDTPDWVGRDPIFRALRGNAKFTELLASFSVTGSEPVGSET
jgi:tetratricopeptide (TPR) repeat protein